MPQTTPERAARWRGDADAISFLTHVGYELLPSWEWRLPAPDHTPTDREEDAMIYLIEEWDFGGVEEDIYYDPA